MTEETVAALRAAGRKFSEAQAARDAAMAELAAAIRAADAAGVNRSEIQRQAAVARQTVYRALNEQVRPA